ncbi:hypothetical protein MUBE_08260 [Mycobacterium uberis]|uniref:Uncharacterized protein n=1 Tax=Mycobacterium uberis TaxID=2162698 RepID=A0A3E1HGG0_9MYCO|nr:hypothetical protein MUBE_08260 [Mycobacterium uberis]
MIGPSHVDTNAIQADAKSKVVDRRGLWTCLTNLAFPSRLRRAIQNVVFDVTVARGQQRVVYSDVTEVAAKATTTERKSTTSVCDLRAG